MSWYHASWKFRAPIAVNNNGGASTIDVEAVMPKAYGLFWDNVQSDLDDVRITLADGHTVASYALSGLDYANKVVTLQVDGVTANSSDATVLLWLYWGNAAAAAASTSVTISSAKTGSVITRNPGTPSIKAGMETPGATKPRQTISKASAEEVDVWWDLRPLMAIRSRAHNKSRLLDEIDYVQFAVTTGTGGGISTHTSMMDEAKTRFVHPAWAATRVKAGTSGTDYTMSLTVKTADGRTFNPRALVKVRDVSE
jgi:hypothetical protein